MPGILNISKKLLGDNVTQYLPLAVNKVRRLHKLVVDGIRIAPVINITAAEDGAIIEQAVLNETQGSVTIIAGLKYLTIGVEAVNGFTLTRSTNGRKVPFGKKPVTPSVDGIVAGINYTPLPKYKALLVQNGGVVGVRQSIVYQLLSPTGKLTPLPEARTKYINFGPVTLPITEPQIQHVGTSGSEIRLLKLETDYSSTDIPTRVLLVYASRSLDSGKTFSVPAPVISHALVPGTAQYLGRATYVGNSTVLAMSGETVLNPSIDPVPVPMMLRSTDAGASWTETSLASLFAWLEELCPDSPDQVTDVANKRYRARFYQLIVKQAQMIPLGDGTVVVVGYRPIPDFRIVLDSWTPDQSPYPSRYTEVWIWRSTNNGQTFDSGTRVANSYTKVIPLGHKGVALISVNGLFPYLSISDDAGQTWTHRVLPLGFAEAGEPFNELLSNSQAWPLGSYGPNPSYVDYYGMSFPRPILLSAPVLTEAGKINKDAVEIGVPLFNGVAYFMYTTTDGGTTWTKDALLSEFNLGPQALRHQNFREIHMLTDSGFLAFPNMNDNKGEPL